ncbi:MAG: rhodanese-like domain-containing protein [Planctomycetota bacterium]
MSSYVLKVIVIFVISAVGAGIQLWAAWPVQLKADPEAPPEWSPPSGGNASGGNTEPVGGEIADPDPDPEPVVQETDDEPFVLDSLEITLDQARWLHERGLATFVDARVTAEFEEGHIETAMNISPAALEANSSLFALDVIDPALPIVIYCGGGDCDDSHRVAELLQDLRGFEQTHVFTDGYQTWADAGLPTSTGPDPFAE